MANVVVFDTTGVDTTLWIEDLMKISTTDLVFQSDISGIYFDVALADGRSLVIQGSFAVGNSYYSGTITNLNLSDGRGGVAQISGLQQDFPTFYNQILNDSPAGIRNVLLNGSLRTWAFYGEAGDDAGVGGNLADVLIGFGGADRLDGGLGDDRLLGGSAVFNDDYTIDYDAMVDDEIVDPQTGVGTGVFYVDVLTGGGGDDIYHVGIGDQVIELANGGTDEMRVAGSAIIAAEVEILTLLGTGDFSAIGDAAANTLIGNTGNNQISGSGGNDTMVGGAGNDSYEVDSALDVVTETEDQGDDTIRSSASFTLPVDVEHLVLTGSGNINATGRDIGFNADELVGNSGKNVLNGMGGADVLKGGAGDDTLDGGAGLDTMTGGDGSDIYVVDNSGDKVTETSTSLTVGGKDTVKSSISYTLGANIENLLLLSPALNGTGNGLANVITGNDLANTLSGLGGADRLDGGTGQDKMSGGDGSDVYLVDNTKDVVTESNTSLTIGGKDTVQASVSYMLSANVEDLLLLSAAVSGTGNGLGNFITGNDLANTLSGFGGADRLDGGKGQDKMSGGDGSDVYLVDNSKDVVTESNTSLTVGGKDTVQASVSYTLGANVENLLLLSPAVKGTGNGLANAITGNSLANTLSGLAGADVLKGEAGADILIGGEGADALYGGADKDVFRFTSFKDSAATSTKLDLMDSIMDFKRGADDIDLSALDANALLSDNQAFKLDTNGDFKAGEIKLVKSGANMIVLVNTDADSASELAIRVMAVSKLDAGDFIL